MSELFTKALQQLGHIYEPRPASENPGLRHIEKVYVPTGELRPICGETGTGLGCPDLWLDSNCVRCREIERLAPAALTKRSLMHDLVNLICNIEQQWLDAMYWNHHNPNEDPINPDPDGVLAKAWIENKMQLVAMMGRFEPTMKRHEGRFGWPEEFDGQ